MLSWSSGKDSAWALHELRRTGDVEVIALLTTFNEAADRVAMHAVRRELARAQARSTGLPLWEVELPSPCSNEEYERKMLAATKRSRDTGATHVAFGDLFLEEVRRYREERLLGTGLLPLFPLWGRDTALLARVMIEAGLVAHLTAVDPRRPSPHFVGGRYDERLLDALPRGVDPCGERGEFHTFVSAGPMFSLPLDVVVGERLDRDGFWVADVLPRNSSLPPSLDGAHE